MRYGLFVLAAFAAVAVSTAEAQVVVHPQDLPQPVQYPRAVVSDFNPRSGPPGTRVILRGNGFSPYTQVLVGGQPAGTYAISQSQLEFVIPSGTWDGRIQVRSPGMPEFFVGQFQVTQGYMYLDDFQPYGGAAGTTVRITGRGFQPGVRVFLSGREVTIRQLSGAHLDVVIPPGARTDYFTVQMTNGAQLVSPRPFVVSNGNWMPQVSGFYPQVVRQGDRVTIVGTGFYGGAQVFVGGQRAVIVHTTPMSIDFTVPSTPGGQLIVRFPGTGDLNVGVLQLGHYNPGPIPPRPGPGPGPTPLPPPGQAMVISRIQPSSGSPGTLVRIYGTSFGPNSRAYFGGQEMQITRTDRSQIEAYIPNNARSSEFIVVRDRDGQARSPEPFRVQDRPGPGPGPGQGDNITFSPREGRPGTEVELYVRNFRDRDNVMLGGMQIAVLRADRDRVRVVIPQNVDSGRFSIYRGGWMVAQSNEIFEVRRGGGGHGGGGGGHGGGHGDHDRLEVWDFNPNQAWSGHEVKIKGRGFDNDVRVYFGNLPCTVTRVDRDEIRIVIPHNAYGAQFLTIDSGRDRVTTRDRLQIKNR
jgi:IPT/TIG domain